MLAAIPSPTQAVWHLGPLPVRAYALCIIAGIVFAIWLGGRRWRDPELYFKALPGETHAQPLNAFKIWDGGLGIWGAIAMGTLGAWIGCRRHHIKLTVFADATVIGVVFAQGIGRLGNWFNNELYGGATSLPWGLQIHCLDADRTRAVLCDGTSSTTLGYFQPTFLYELIWDVALGVALLLIDRRLRLGRGNVMALYAMGYTIGRAWIEALRTDHANHVLGLRLNDWTCLIVFLLGLAWFLRHGAFRAEREATPYRDGSTAATDTVDEPVADPARDEV